MAEWIWLDTDLALGALWGDVDDGWAVATLVRAAPERVVGASSTFGNAPVRVVTRALIKLLAELDAPVDVVAGAGAGGQVTPAAEAIAALPEGSTVLALGPLTNVAAALRIDPTLASRVSVSFVGGNLTSRGKWPPIWPFEFNLSKDADAARAVFASPIPKRVFPLDVCKDLVVGPRELLRIRRASPVGEHLVRHSWRWLAYAPVRYRAFTFPLWDVVPVLDALGLTEMRESKRRLRFEGRGRLVRDDGATESTCIVGFDRQRALASVERALA